jgi:hypothetical protein
MLARARIQEGERLGKLLWPPIARAIVETLATPLESSYS